MCFFRNFLRIPPLSGYVVSLLGTIAGSALPALAEEDIALTPARLSYVEGQVDMQRGVEDWAPALLNTPLVAGDALYTGPDGRLELQIGPRTFVRAAGNTGLTLHAHGDGWVRIGVSDGLVSIDNRDSTEPVRVDALTPHAELGASEPGYYRIEVYAEETRFTADAGGRGIVSYVGGRALALGPQRTVIVGDRGAERQTASAPLDDWDRWNASRTEHMLASRSSEYLPDGAYGGEWLDEGGDWRVEASYGPVWYPRTVRYGWSPFSTGNWVRDRYYGWSWVDAQPWGWAPSHYGRWLFLNNRWGWCPRSPFAAPVYSPALVHFFDSPFAGHGSVRWRPLGFYDPFDPWYQHGGAYHHRHHRRHHDHRARGNDPAPSPYAESPVTGTPAPAAPVVTTPVTTTPPQAVVTVPAHLFGGRGGFMTHALRNGQVVYQTSPAPGVTGAAPPQAEVVTPQPAAPTVPATGGTQVDPAPNTAVGPIPSWRGRTAPWGGAAGVAPQAADAPAAGTATANAPGGTASPSTPPGTPWSGGAGNAGSTPVNPPAATVSPSTGESGARDPYAALREWRSRTGGTQATQPAVTSAAGAPAGTAAPATAPSRAVPPDWSQYRGSRSGAYGTNLSGGASNAPAQSPGVAPSEGAYQGWRSRAYGNAGGTAPTTSPAPAVTAPSPATAAPATTGSAPQGWYQRRNTQWGAAAASRPAPGTPSAAPAGSSAAPAPAPTTGWSGYRYGGATASPGATPSASTAASPSPSPSSAGSGSSAPQGQPYYERRMGPWR
jgi:hypothetical protein